MASLTLRGSIRAATVRERPLSSPNNCLRTPRCSVFYIRTCVSAPMIHVERLRLAYGSVAAVDGLSLTARPGEIFGLLGPNGAGKTTCISCICGLLKPTAGRVSVMGYDTTADGRRARQALGVVPQEIALYDDLSAAENLAYWGGAHRMHGRSLRDRVRIG